MSDLLKQAIEQVSQLPDERQRFYAQLLLDALADEQEWDEQFAKSLDALELLADEALQDANKGMTTDLTAENLDEIL